MTPSKEDKIMEHTIMFDNDMSCSIISANGPATVRDLSVFIDEVLKDDRWRSGMNVIVDYRLAELNDLTSSDAHALADTVKGLKDKVGTGRVAHVVSRTVDFGMVRMWENLIEDQVSFDFRVFYSMDDALRWIVSPSM
jgi:hypothetical protein